VRRRRRIARFFFALILCVSEAPAAPGDLDVGFGNDFDPITGRDRLGPGVTRIDADAPVDYLNARGLAVAAGGRILAAVAGGSGVYGFLPNGLPDPAFGTPTPARVGHAPTGSSYELRDIAVQADGRIVGVGLYDGPDLPYHVNHLAALVRLLPDGIPDPSFGAGGFVALQGSRNEELLAVALQPDGTIVAGGRVRAVKEKWTLRRLLADGNLDRSFGSRGRVRYRPNRNGGHPLEVLVRDDGRLITAGWSWADTDGGDVTLIAYDRTGRPEGSFGRRGQVITSFDWFDIAWGAALQSDGKVVVAATSAPVDGEERWLVLRYLADGSLDPGFGTGGVVETDFGGEAEAYAIAVQPDGKIVAAGEAEEVVALARYHPDGTLDATFGAGGLVRTPIVEPGIDYAEALAIALQSDGDILVTGAACRIATDSCPIHFLARYQGG
jgi:uncharacterized delta-60 repeat protein